MRVVVIGGGFGGLAVAQGLAGSGCDVTLLDRRNHHLFQPLLYQVATAALSPSDIAEPLRSIVRGVPNVRVRLGEVVGVDLEAREVHLEEDGAEGRDRAAVPYDRLVIAAGARDSWFGHDAWAEHASGLKSLGDALRIRQRILLAFERAEWETDPGKRRALLTFVVIGGGPTGVELAGALAEIAFKTMIRDFRNIDPTEARVLLVEGAEGVLMAYPPALREKALAQVKALGVEVRLKTLVTDLVEGAVLLGDERVETETVLWAAGVQAASIARGLGVETDRMGRLVVQDDCSLPGHPDVYAIGDIACFAHTADGRPLPGLAPVAQQMGRYVARRLQGVDTGPFAYTDRGSMATIGRRRAVMKAGRVELAGFVAWVLWGVVHLGFLITFRNRVVVMLKWAWAWMTFDRASRLIWTQGERS
ncbi:MAG: NAD(P)/FAD-dependent oxidoreductase [Myxococcales bacterium]|nr:NAD(P)/FAD-dependent oxidoreductase [Myxococcales bacterium]